MESYCCTQLHVCQDFPGDLLSCLSGLPQCWWRVTVLSGGKLSVRSLRWRVTVVLSYILVRTVRGSYCLGCQDSSNVDGELLFLPVESYCSRELMRVIVNIVVASRPMLILFSLSNLHELRTSPSSSVWPKDIISG